jgi:hypothetical protein
VLISCLSTGIDKEVSLPILTPLLLAPACDACLPPLQTELRINFSAILQKMNINPHTLGGGSRLKLQAETLKALLLLFVLGLFCGGAKSAVVELRCMRRAACACAGCQLAPQTSHATAVPAVPVVPGACTAPPCRARRGLGRQEAQAGSQNVEASRHAGPAAPGGIQ